MKIGFSFGRCIRDIVNGTVDYDDVLLIYAATMLLEEEHVENMVKEYMHRRNYLQGLDEEECLAVALRLYRHGKVHQPRCFKASPMYIQDAGVWMDLAPTVTGDSQQNELVQKTWRDYQMALKLTSSEPLPEDQFKKKTPEEEAELAAAVNLLAGFI